jgi:hypothetical protein
VGQEFIVLGARRIFLSEKDAVHHEGKERRLLERFQWLRDRGLDVATENDNNQTCVDIATYHKNEVILELFREEK